MIGELAHDAEGRKKGLLAIRQARKNAPNMSTRSAHVSLYVT